MASAPRNGFLGAIGLNAVAFALVIAVQQLIVFPALSKLVSVTEFAATILFITLSTVLVNVLGGEVSNVSLLRHGQRALHELPWDSPRLLLGGMTLVTTGAAAATMVFAPIQPAVTAQFLAVTLLGMARVFGSTPEKASNEFHLVVVVHGAYAVGAVLGLSLVGPLRSSIVPFLSAELLAVAVVVVVRLRRRAIRLTLRRTEDFSAARRQFLQLALVAILMNTVAYLDRLVIVPLLGAAALSAYYAASALAKSLSMVTNPAANALLARVGAVGDERATPLFSKASRLAVIGWGGLFTLSLALSVAGLAVLYPVYFEVGLSLVVPVAVAAASGSASDLVRPLIMRFVPTSRFLLFNVAYALVFVVSILVFSSLWGLVGFAWGGALARTTLLTIYLVQARYAARLSSAAIVE